ncbi:hypothetical protein K502DRAFT_353976 [Neoconidiobolus thromboides FSU 785]|nr:hypothetical protein K502DRAFT_353976 [Neoconidiobolus thromboides FSU 785]
MAMDRGYTIDISDKNLGSFFNQSSNEIIVHTNGYFCFVNGLMSIDIISNNIDKCYYSICNEYYCKRNYMTCKFKGVQIWYFMMDILNNVI